MTISAEKRERTYAVFGGRCGYCVTRWATHLDHLVPKALGGSDSYANLVPACDLCGHGKGGRTLAEWVAYLASQIAAGVRVVETAGGPMELPAPMLCGGACRTG